MSDTVPEMKVKSFLARESVFINVRAGDKVSLLRDLAHRAENIIHVSWEAIFNEISRREELGSTGIGRGVAIPHARVPGVETPFALAARLRPAINFDAIDDQPVDLVFLLLIPPSSSKDHLNVLAAVSRKLRDPSTVDRLRKSQDDEAFYRTLTAE